MDFGFPAHPDSLDAQFLVTHCQPATSLKALQVDDLRGGRFLRGAGLTDTVMVIDGGRRSADPAADAAPTPGADAAEDVLAVGTKGDLTRSHFNAHRPTRSHGPVRAAASHDLRRRPIARRRGCENSGVQRSAVMAGSPPAKTPFALKKRRMLGSHTRTPSKKSSIGVLSPRLCRTMASAPAEAIIVYHSLDV